MSTGEGSEPAVEEGDEAGETDAGMSERTAKAVLLVVAAGALAGIVVAFPYVAYFLSGIVACRGWQEARARLAARHGDGPGDGPQNAEEVDAGAVETWRVPTFHELCESLARVGTPHAHIAVLAHDLGTTPERVREALDACGVQVEAVRMQGRGSSTGVKGDALPAPRSTPGSVVGAGQPANNDNNNGEGAAPGEGLRVEPIGLSGHVVRDPADAVRHHKTAPWGHSGAGR